MTALSAGAREVISLPPYNAISITVSGVGHGSIERMGNNPGEASFGVVDITANATFGPYAVQTRHMLRCVQPGFNYDVAPADFPAVTSDVERIIKLSQAQYNADRVFGGGGGGGNRLVLNGNGVLTLNGKTLTMGS